MKEERISLFDRSKKYNRDELQRQEVERKQKLHIEKEMAECSFKPKINRSKYMKTDQTHATNQVTVFLILYLAL
jgi:hypothetical protein